MAAEDPNEVLARALDLPVRRVDRAARSYDIVVGLGLEPGQHAALLQGFYRRAEQTPPDDARAAEMLALGQLGGRLDGLRALSGAEDGDLRAAVLAFDQAELSETISSLLEEIIGVAAATYTPPPEPEPEAEADTAPEEAEEGGMALPPAPSAEELGRWDVIFCGYDPAARRHRLTLLRAGVELDGPVLPEDAEWGEGSFAAERLYEDALEPSRDGLDDEELSTLLGFARPFQTPALPELDAQLAQLQERHGPFTQLYLLEVGHGLPSPSQLSQTFTVQEVGERGRRQVLSRSLGCAPEGLGVASAAAELRSRWDAPAQLLEPGTTQPYRPPLLAPGAPAALTMSGGWQTRTRWSLRLRPLVDDGPRLPIQVRGGVRGVIEARGQGQLQENLSASVGLFAAIYDGEGQCLYSTAAAPGERVEDGVEWGPGVSTAAGALTVAAGNVERDLSAGGVRVAAEFRADPGLTPRMEARTALPEQPPLELAAGALHLEGAVVVEQTTRSDDGLRSTQSTATVRGQAAASVELRLGLGGVRIALRGAGGSVRVDDVPRWMLSWHTAAQTAEAEWEEPIDLLSGGGWGDGEPIRDTVAATHRVAVERLAVGYLLAGAVAEEEE